MAFAAVEIKIGLERLRLLIQEKNRAVLIHDEQPIGAAGLLANRVHPRQQSVVLAHAVHSSRDWHGCVVADFQHGRWRLWPGRENADEQKDDLAKSHNANYSRFRTAQASLASPRSR